ncbi:MAG TPA: methyltransferase domain-containing protein [Candidatus Methylomirabilis sp.]|nr:methyltransferase domain-containing protein [Candidatus Methylomirabilis sp.]
MIAEVRSPRQGSSSGYEGTQAQPGPPDRLVSLLACPGCRGGVRLDPSGAARIVCDTCGARYAVVDGVPCMLTAASRSSLDRGKDIDPTAGLRRRWWSVWLGRIVRATSLGGPTHDPGQAKRIRALVRELGEGAAILDLGSGGRCWGSTVIGMDVDRFPHVGVVGDGHRLPFADGVLDGVICTGVLEHVEDAEAVTREIWRVLRAGGVAYVAVPFMQGYHPASGTHQDFRRLTHIGLQRLLAGFEQVDSGISGGPSSSVAWILREYLAMLFVGSGRMYQIAYAVSGWLTTWIKYLDVLLIHRPAAHRIACGFYVLGRKPMARTRTGS